MAKKQTSTTKKASAATVSAEETQPKNVVKQNLIPWIVGILLLTIFAYWKGFSPDKTFTNWDDPGYVVEQPLTKSLHPDTVNLHFRPETQVMLNYHPLTMLTLAYNYSQSGLDIQPYFKTNLALHVLNTLFVFFLIYGMMNKKVIPAAFVALLFGIHPMHVESVAWISERKDVLYTFFFLLSLLSYNRYLKQNNLLWLLTCFALFVASCLSKAMAVPLPLVLFLLDYWNDRKFTLKTFVEKIPFLALAVWFGLNAVKIQSQGALAEYEVFTTFQRIMFASYGFMMYWVKLVFPVNLSAFYPYPTFGPDKSIPTIFYAAPFLVFGTIVGITFWLFKKRSSYLKIWVFSLGFFVLMIALVLQFISVGAAIMADRYTYIPYIGALFLLVFVLWDVFEKRNKTSVFLLVFGSFSLFSFVLTYERVGVWTNSETLWSDVIEKYPYKIEQKGNVVTVLETGVEVAHKNRGNYYREMGNMDKAFEDYELLVRARAKDPLIYSNMGNMYALRGDFPSSLEMYKMALERDPNAFDVYLNRGITLSKMQRNNEAISDFKKALKIQPNHEMTMVNMCGEYVTLGKWNEAIQQATTVIKSYPNNNSAYFYRGTAYVNLGKNDIGLADLNKCIELKPDYGFAWFNAAVAYKNSGNKLKAAEYAQKAQALNVPQATDFISSL